MDTTYNSAESLFDALRKATSKEIGVFRGSYTMTKDPLVSPHEKVRMTAVEVWTATGYRFTYVPIGSLAVQFY